MKDMNNTNLIGRLTRDPELKYTPDGLPVASFSIAVNGYKKDKVSFFDLTAFRKTAEIVGQYAKKGKQVAIGGYLEQERWESKEGQKRSKVKIIVNDIQLLGSKKDEGQDTSNG